MQKRSDFLPYILAWLCIPSSVARMRGKRERGNLRKSNRSQLGAIKVDQRKNNGNDTRNYWERHNGKAKGTQRGLVLPTHWRWYAKSCQNIWQKITPFLHFSTIASIKKYLLQLIWSTCTCNDSQTRCTTKFKGSQSKTSFPSWEEK